MIVAKLAGKHLHFAAQPAERSAVKNSVAIALKRTSILVLRLFKLAPLRLVTEKCVGREQHVFANSGQAKPAIDEFRIFRKVIRHS